MTNRIIFITEFDLDRLLDLIEGIRKNRTRIKSDLDSLERELNRAKVVQPAEIPADVITMNSRVHLKDLEAGEDLFYTLVFPSDADFGQNKISILAPIGTALLGYRVGDEIEWKVPSGIKRMKVIEVIYQPEASGDYDR